MTQLKRSIFVIPSSALEDLPPRMGHQLASDFLAAWTSQWDPRLLVALGTLPEWKKADGSSLDLNASLVLCPDVSCPKIEVSTREQMSVNQCIVVESQSRPRPELVQALLDVVSAVESNEPAERFAASQPPLLIEDFYALGYAVLQVQILARKLRYSWNIDWIMFSEQVLSAARASLADNAEETEQWLQASFDSLSQERDRYCSQQAYLLDVVLLASSTLGTSLNRQMEVSHPFSLIATSKLLRELKEKNPGAWTCLNRLVTDKACSLLGGLEVERPHAYLSSGSIVRELGRGLRSYTEIDVAPPKVFTRFQPGFLASSPTWLTQFGYTGAFLAAWSGGAVPDKDQAKIRWQASDDGKSLDTVLGHVLDAASADSYIDLAVRLSSQLDYHHIPTLVLAHWPGIRLVALDDFLRVIARTPALGKFHAAEDYFATTTQPYSSDSFPSNTFKVPVPTNLLDQHQLHQRLVSYEKNRVQAERLWSLSHLWEQVGSNASNDTNAASPEQTEIAELLSQIDGSFDETISVDEVSQKIANGKAKMMARIQKTLGGGTAQPEANTASAYLAVNPANHSQRMFLSDLPGAIDSASCTRILAAETKSGKSRVVIDIPPFGFVRFRVNASSDSSLANVDSSKPSLWKRIAGARSGIAQPDWTLANEFMEIQIDPKKGHLRSVYIANKRGSHLSGMTSLVRGPVDVLRKWNDEDCLELANVQFKLVESTQLVGIIEVTGTAKNSNGTSARVTTRYTLWKGSRSIEIDIVAEGMNLESCGCVWRTAWQNEGSGVAAWYQGVKGKLQGPLQGTVELIEVDDADHRIFIAPQGLSAHRRSGSRFLISNLPVDGEGKSRASFAIGLDWPRPYETAMDRCDAPWLTQAPFAGDKPDSGAWLAQCSLSNVNLAWDDTRPVLDASFFPAEESDTWTGQTADGCIWLREMQGRRGSAKLSFFHNVSEAWRVDCQGREFDTLSVVDGQVVLEVQAYEQSRILLRWDFGKNEAKAT
jgi:alpha-mannosidase